MYDMYEKKRIMYSMIQAIEEDFIQLFLEKLTLEKITKTSLDKAHRACGDETNIETVLRALDLQSYIEIANNNITRLGITISDKSFLNEELAKIIPIRNKVMHPRILEFYDYPDLSACFYALPSNLLFYEWKSIQRISKLINDGVQNLPDIPKWLRKSEAIIENIPETTDFDETTFIGRREEIGEIRQQLFRSHVHILSIIGDGGVGKTALVLKLLYDLLDDDKPKFDIIIWVSFKTSTLNNFEFASIKNAISTVPDMYENLKQFLGNSDDVKDDIIEFSKVFRTLFVLDNLETINTEDVKQFLDDVSEHAKIIITSRIGLGEMEHRYRLEGLNNSDVLEYFKVLLDLYGFEGRFTQSEKQKYAVEELHSNPLAIKWFVRGLYEGLSPKQLLAAKNDVISFCMSNVYSKLGSVERKILDTVVLLRENLSYAELLYFLCCDSADDIYIRDAINALIKSNFLDRQSFDNSIIEISPFAREYLLSISRSGADMVKTTNSKQKQLRTFTQDMQIKGNTASIFNVYCVRFFIKSPERTIAAYYLNEALKLSYKKDWSGAHKLIDLAEHLAPRYFECNKIRGFLLSSSNPTKSKTEYIISIDKAENLPEETVAKIFYAGFLIRNSEYPEAITILEKLNESYNGILDSNSLSIKLELMKALAGSGQFDPAQEIADSISEADWMSIKEKNILLTRKSNILKRRFESLKHRDRLLNKDFLKQAMTLLNECEHPDTIVFKSMLEILFYLSNYLSDDDITEFMISVMDRHYRNLRNITNYKTFHSNMLIRLATISNQKKKLQLGKYFLSTSEMINELDENQGIVNTINRERGFGFFINAKYPKGVHFRLQPNEPCELGSIIGYDIVYNTPEIGNMIKHYVLVN